jgi:DNA-binding transcriptional ArsR family regulator
VSHPKALAALADPTRRSLFEKLRQTPTSVADLAETMPISRPAVSQHLKVLKDAGLVVDEARGNRRIYRIDPSGLGPLRAWLDQFWEDALDKFKAEAEKPDGKS